MLRKSSLHHKKYGEEIAVKKSGFTLVELMIVVAIISIIALMATLSMGDTIKKAKDGRVIALTGSLRSAAGGSINSDKSKIYTDKISEIKKYLPPQLEKIVGEGDSDISETDTITSIEVVAGTSKKDGSASIGKVGGKFEGKENIVELFYDSDTGTIVIDGAGASSEKSIKEYKDTKKRYWKEY
jgi:prepilin-type N-terminal cleavage/methylation domain-containing protein